MSQVFFQNCTNVFQISLQQIRRRTVFEQSLTSKFCKRSGMVKLFKITGCVVLHILHYYVNTRNDNIFVAFLFLSMLVTATVSLASQTQSAMKKNLRFCCGLIDLIVRIQSGNCFLMLLRIPLSLWKYVVYIKLLAQCCMKMEVNIF